MKDTGTSQSKKITAERTMENFVQRTVDDDLTCTLGLRATVRSPDEGNTSTCSKINLNEQSQTRIISKFPRHTTFVKSRSSASQISVFVNKTLYVQECIGLTVEIRQEAAPG